MLHSPFKLREAVEGIEAIDNFYQRGEKLLLKSHMMHAGFHTVWQSLFGEVEL